MFINRYGQASRLLESYYILFHTRRPYIDFYRRMYKRSLYDALTRQIMPTEYLEYNLKKAAMNTRSV